jgi:Cys-rich protein (TIGR01571 family)
LQAKAVDIATQEGMVVPYILPCLLGCIGGAINRGKIREVYKIDGNFVTDCLLHFLCPLCAVTQEYREVNHRSSGN